MEWKCRLSRLLVPFGYQWASWLGDKKESLICRRGFYHLPGYWRKFEPDSHRKAQWKSRVGVESARSVIVEKYQSPRMAPTGRQPLRRRWVRQHRCCLRIRLNGFAHLRRPLYTIAGHLSTPIPISAPSMDQLVYWPTAGVDRSEDYRSQWRSRR